MLVRQYDEPCEPCNNEQVVRQPQSGSEISQISAVQVHLLSAILPFVLMPAISSPPLKSPFASINFHLTEDLAYRENDKRTGIRYQLSFRT